MPDPVKKRGLEKEPNLGKVLFTPIGVVSSPIQQTLHPQKMRAVPCRIILDERFTASAKSLKPGHWMWVIYYLHQIQPEEKIALEELFLRRSPRRPNPIGITLVKVTAIHGATLEVSGLDACDGSPILDLKPYRAYYDFPAALQRKRRRLPMIPASVHPYYVPLPQRTLLMAHRGGGGLWPQNTLHAFEHAVELDADILETDIHLSEDNVVMVMHDEILDNLTDGSGPLRNQTLEELKQLDAGYRWTADGGRTHPYRGQGIAIPTLEELFQRFPEKHFNIDIKEVQPGLVEEFVRLILAYKMEEKVLVASFQHENITAFRLACPQVATAASQKETLDFFLLQSTGLGRLFRSSALVFQVPEKNGALRITSPNFIRIAHELGMRVDVWTVDEENDMRRLIEWGADGLFTDRPDRMKTVLAS